MTSKFSKLILVILLLGYLSAFGQTAKDYWMKGSKLYLDGNYKEAGKQYLKAFDLEKSNRTLTKSEYYVLIDNLGMSYGITGNIKDAIKIFEYGVSIDPTYPMFYYNLACCYGEQNDIDNTVRYLELAIKYKNNMLEGEELANPYEDNSFQKFIDNDKFIKIVGKAFPKISIDILKLTNTEVPNNYSITNKIRCISIQAYTFYDKPDLFEAIIGKIKHKDIQNFESDKDKGCIMYFEFEEKFNDKAKGFLESFIWGEKQPTKMHPETLFTKGKYLIIWSFNEGSQIKTISENKIKAIFK